MSYFKFLLNREKVVQKLPTTREWRRFWSLTLHSHSEAIPINISLWCSLYNIWACHSPEDSTIISSACLAYLLPAWISTFNYTITVRTFGADTEETFFIKKGSAWCHVEERLATYCTSAQRCFVSTCTYLYFLFAFYLFYLLFSKQSLSRIFLLPPRALTFKSVIAIWKRCSLWHQKSAVGLMTAQATPDYGLPDL